MEIVCLCDPNTMTHQCTVCLKQFEFVSKLKRHQLSHSGQRPFTCYVCLKSFRQSAHLKGHLKSHSKLREVSLVVSQAVHSELPYTKREKSHGARILEEEHLGEGYTWYRSLQMSKESESEHQNDGMNRQKHVKHLIINNGTCDSAQGSYDGFEGLSREESLQNCQYADCADTRLNSANTIEFSEKQEHLGTAYSTRNTHKADSVMEERTVKMANRHQCSVCLKYFSAPSKLKRHILIHSSLRPYCCKFCPKAFRQLAHLKFHLSTHFSHRRDKAFPANTVCQNPSHPLNTLAYCSKPFNTQLAEEAGDLEKELNGSENLPMGSFPKNMKRVESLNGAENWTKRKVEHKCSVCHKSFSAPSKLRRHCLIHTGQRPFQCSLCCRAFRQLSHLKAHHRVHTGPRRTSASSPQTHRPIQPQPFPSKTPKARLKRLVNISLAKNLRSVKQRLKISAAHLSASPDVRIKTDGKISEPGAVRSSQDQEEIKHRRDYSCSMCSKHFSAPSKLRRHILTHTGQRPFRCLVCFRGFRQKSHLKVHKCKESRGTLQSSGSDVHLGDPDDFGSNVSLRHGDEMGGEISKSSCGTEDSCASPSTGLAARPNNPEHSGDLSSLSIKAMPRPLDEANQSKDSGYQCTVCFKIFDFPSKLSRHLLTHVDIKPFECSICSRSFRQLCHLQSHSKVHAMRKNTLCKETYKKGMETSMAEISETFTETNTCETGSEKLQEEQNPDPYCDDQDLILVTNSVHSHSMNIEEFTPADESTSFPVEVHGDEVYSSQLEMKTNQCIFCLKTFDFPSKLSRHLPVHTGLRPYECYVCCKSFKQLSHLQCHQWVHKRKDNGELKASVVNHSSPISCGETSLTDEPVLYQESLAMLNQGHDENAVQVHHQKWIPKDNSCGPSDSGHGQSKVKSETDLQMDRSVYPTLKHDSSPFGPDTSGLDLQAEKVESKNFKSCLNRTGEVHASGVSMTMRNLVWKSMDQHERHENRDLGPFAQKIERGNLHSLPFCINEDSSQRSPTIPDASKLKLNHHHQDSESGEAHDQHLTEPPNDLPICPSCSQCFDSLQNLHTHDCPVRCPKQRPSKSYQCAICFKSFEAPSKLKRHYVIHTGQRPYHCNMCDKDFTQSSHLKTHMLSHR